MEINYTKLILQHVITLNDEELKKFYNKMIKPKKIKPIRIKKNLNISIPKNIILDKILDDNIADNIFSFINETPKKLKNIEYEIYLKYKKEFDSLLKDKNNSESDIILECINRYTKTGEIKWKIEDNYIKLSIFPNPDFYKTKNIHDSPYITILDYIRFHHIFFYYEYNNKYRANLSGIGYIENHYSCHVHINNVDDILEHKNFKFITICFDIVHKKISFTRKEN